MIPFLVLAIIGAIALTKARKNLSSLQEFVLMLGILAVLCILEVVFIWLQNRHKKTTLSGSPFELIGMKGVVKADCSPTGTVEVGQETWSAVSVDGEILKSGEMITVIDRQGLKLIIKKATDINPDR